MIIPELLHSLEHDNREGPAQHGTSGSPRKKQENGKGSQQQTGKGTENASRGTSPARAEFTLEQAEAVRRITR